MNILIKETKIVQNQALGASLLWRFTTGYSKDSNCEHTPLQLLFIVLPLLFHYDTYLVIKSTLAKSGLRAFTNKLGESKISKNDLILSLQGRILEMKELTISSFCLAIATKLITIDYITGKIIPITDTKPKLGIPSTINNMLNNAEKIGKWCSELTIYEITNILRIRF